MLVAPIQNVSSSFGPRAAIASNSVITVSSEELAGAHLIGGAGNDTLQLTGGGTFDLRLPLSFASIETIRGSALHDAIVLDQQRFGGILVFEGGEQAGTHWDELLLHGTAFDFTTKTLIGIDRLSLQTDHAVLTVADEATALLASGIASQNDRLVAAGVTFAEAKLRLLHRAGIDTIVDAAGTHVNTAPVVADLHGDRIETSSGKTVFVDAGRDATLSDDDGSFALLDVLAPRGIDAPGSLRLDTSGAVSLAGGYAAGSAVLVHGVEVGMVWDAGDASLRIAFNTHATAARVAEILHALTFTTAQTPPQASAEQSVTVTLSDEGGRRSSATVTIAQDVAIPPPRILLSHAGIPELSPGGTLVGLLTVKILSGGDGYAFTLLDSAGGRFTVEGDRLLVAGGIV